jgi:hypothetical protein
MSNDQADGGLALLGAVRTIIELPIGDAGGEPRKMRREREAPNSNAVKSSHWFGPLHRIRIGLTGRLFLLVILAVVPALVIQAWNEYDLRIAREDDIRHRVVQITKQFGE